MKTILAFGLFFVTICSNGQVTTHGTSRSSTAKFSGTYSFGTSAEKGRVGTIIIYPESDSTILFYVDLNRGAPSYNMGSLYGRMKIINGNGTFYYKFDHADKGCRWTIKFEKDNLSIKTISDQDECGFGAHVYPDADYKRTSDKVLDSFENMEGTKVFFKTTKPGDYYK